MDHNKPNYFSIILLIAKRYFILLLRVVLYNCNVRHLFDRCYMTHHLYLGGTTRLSGKIWRFEGEKDTCTQLRNIYTL